MMQSYIAIGISLPKEILARIDTERGDVPRSRYLLRKLEKMYSIGSVEKNSLGRSVVTGQAVI
jgi:hypothetical protein